MSGSQTRLKQLDGLRGCAIAAVFLQHAYQIKLLWMGVDLFFVLSGFLITGILVNQKHSTFGQYIGAFYARRVRRILPPYLILIAIAVIAFHGPWLRHWYLLFGAMNLISPLRLDYTPAILPLWSLAVEEQFYFLWPLAVFWMSRRQVVRCAAGLLLLAPLLRFICTPHLSNSAWVYELLPFRMDTLAAGALLALLWPELKQRLETVPGLRRNVIAGCIVIAFFSLAGVLILRRLGFTTDANTRIGNTFIYEGTLGLMASTFILALVGVGRRFLTCWPLLWLGRLSYSFYLIHQVALHVLPQMFGLLALVASLVYATISWFALERRILQVKTPERALVTTAS